MCSLRSWQRISGKNTHVALIIKCLTCNTTRHVRGGIQMIFSNSNPRQVCSTELYRGILRYHKQRRLTLRLNWLSLVSRLCYRLTSGKRIWSCKDRQELSKRKVQQPVRLFETIQDKQFILIRIKAKRLRKPQNECRFSCRRSKVIWITLKLSIDRVGTVNELSAIAQILSRNWWLPASCELP